ncbi:gp34 [Sphingomonas phage PAU]|uniref:gp34 n=1 Tax=Sphingomonas phage PAU TaxID=1150991 RepID=UPI0002573127|nr:gp34 [Sphingomonas phage PAU]AFF28032.1 gp34 [Sphingomonas phage PAU]
MKKKKKTLKFYRTPSYDNPTSFYVGNYTLSNNPFEGVNRLIYDDVRGLRFELDSLETKESFEKLLQEIVDIKSKELHFYHLSILTHKTTNTVEVITRWIADELRIKAVKSVLRRLGKYEIEIIEKVPNQI